MELMLTLDERSVTPLQRQLYDELRQAILSGRLGAGCRVPSTRMLAQQLGVSRTTLTQGYEQLLSEGYLEAARGAGTFVCRELPESVSKNPYF